MRIVGGKFRGRSIKSPPGQNTRPTSDRVRESLFNILEHGVDEFDLTSARVLDLFSGTGALGLEALSRGAVYCLFVEDDADARGVIRENVEALNLTGVTKIWRRDATKLGGASPMSPFELIFVDPPYKVGLGEKALAAIVDGEWLAPGGIIVLEEHADTTVHLAPKLVQIDRRVYGDTALHFLEYAPLPIAS